MKTSQSKRIYPIQFYTLLIIVVFSLIHLSFEHSAHIRPNEANYSTTSSTLTTPYKADSTVPGRMLSFKDSVFVGVSAPQKAYLQHIVKRGQNLKGLEEYYSISIGDIKYLNPHIHNINNIAAGATLNIPIPIDCIIREDNEMTAVKWKVVPLFYRVKKGETLFRIAKVYFDMPIQTLQERNQLATNTLSTGQILHIGWMDVKGIDRKQRTYSGLTGILRQRNVEYKKIYDKIVAAKPNTKPVKQRGIGVWKKTSKRTNTLYAMHRTAKIGSILKVYSPATKRTVYVKVIGRLSDTQYRADVILYLSPAPAVALGAVNERFRLELEFYE